MISLEPGAECFVRFRGRLYRGTATAFPQEEGFVQVRTDCAKLVVHRWGSLTFNLATMRGIYARDAELVVPQSISEWSEATHEFENPPAELVGLDPAIVNRAQPKPEKAVWQHPGKQWREAPKVTTAWLPYADVKDTTPLPAVPRALDQLLPEGYEEGEII